MSYYFAYTTDSDLAGRGSTTDPFLVNTEEQINVWETGLNLLYDAICSTPHPTYVILSGAAQSESQSMTAPNRVYGGVDPKDDAALRRTLRQMAKILDGQPKTYPTPVKIADYGASPGELVLCDPTAAGFTVTLPPAASVTGQTVQVKNDSDSTNVITVLPSGTDTVESGSASISSARTSLLFIAADSTRWIIA